MSDAEVEAALKGLLARMAWYGVALHVCDHYSPRDAYRYLAEDLAEEAAFSPEMRQTRWVQSFMTAEGCEQCAAEMDREMEERDRRPEGDPGREEGEEWGEDEIPF
jgi:hypothetical protein